VAYHDHAPTSIAPRTDGYHSHAVRLRDDYLRISGKSEAVKTFAQDSGQRRSQNCTRKQDTALPHPFFDEFPLRPIFEDLRNRREKKSYHGIYGPQPRKNRNNTGLLEHGQYKANVPVYPTH